MKNSNNLKARGILLALAFLCLAISGNAQEKEGKKKSKKRDWVQIYPSPISPVTPISPITPIQPITPIAPIEPVTPVSPITPITPVTPLTPITPVAPVVPVAPIDGGFDFPDNFEGDTRLSIWKSGDLLVELRGCVRLEKGGMGIRSISKNGYLSIKDKSTGREIYVEELDGELLPVYYKRGKRFDFAGEGQEWFDEIWKDITKFIKR